MLLIFKGIYQNMLDSGSCSHQAYKHGCQNALNKMLKSNLGC